MKKIPTLLVRDPNDRAHVLDEVTPGCEWVLNGEGVATRKYDGTCVMLDDEGKWWARREVKPGKNPPENYILEDFDEVTGKSQGWEPIEQSSFAKWHAEALVYDAELTFTPGTYELCGPKVNGNPEGYLDHVLFKHENAEVIEPPTPHTLEAIKALVLTNNRHWNFEGIVWHHPDGRMAKLKGKDLV